ncbi:MAG: N-acetyltransferase [Mesorhizobium sp.]|nr:N-acetyltransferase [Mesorhizobium sp.]MCO5162570.1 N-acetyltransferase [Mesorhizobium sp.]
MNAVPAPAYAFSIVSETARDIAAREALLDRAMGPGRKRKSSEKIRRGRLPAQGLAFVACGEDGRVVGTVRLWDVAMETAPSSGASRHLLPVGEKGLATDAPSSPHRGEGGSRSEPGEGVSWGRALLLGPLAVEPSLKSAGIGSALMRHAIEEAARLGHGAILLVGDAPYYARFGFSAEKTDRLAMPGPYEKHRFLALELKAGALDGAQGVLKAAGRKAETAKVALAA